MKGIYQLAILSVAILAVAALDDQPLDDFQPFPTSCPAVDPRDTTIHLAHEYDCTKFYMCLRGSKILKDCPFMDQAKTMRLHFNRVLQVCDWPDQAGCTYYPPTRSTTLPPITYPPDYCPSNTNGITIRIVDKDYCDLFFLCTDGVKHLVRCTNGFVVDIRDRLCKPLGTVDCGSRRVTSAPAPPTPAPTPPPTQPPNYKQCPPKGSNIEAKLPHECQCDKFYECFDGDMILRQCPAGLHYDYIRQVCDNPAIVKCVRPIPVSIGDASDFCFDEGKKLEHESSCSSYYECSDGHRTLKHCTAGLHFNYVLQMCDYPEKECEL